MYKILTLSLLSILAILPAFAKNNHSKSLQKSEILDDFRMDANRMNGIIRNNGVWFFDYQTGDSGLEWPKDSDRHPVLAAGQWISMKIDDTVRVAAARYGQSEFAPGEIIKPGLAQDSGNPIYRWYVLRPGDLGDWASWPIQQGAPVDEQDQPLLIGDLTAFSVYHDVRPHYEFETAPLNVEVRQLAVQFDRIDALGDMIFFKWQMTNKSDVAWDSTFFSIWMDSDLGYYADDFVGCDPELGLGFTYNATNNDSIYGTSPPAVGVVFLQGPIVEAPGHSVDLPGGKTLSNTKMLTMNSFIYWHCDDSRYGCPTNARHVWRFQRGNYRDNSQILDNLGHPTTFMYDGDPESGQGWIDSSVSDKRFLVSVGKFPMPRWQDDNGNGLPDFGEAGVQEIVAAVIIARGTNNLNSVTKLKTITKLIQQEYVNLFRLPHPVSPPAPDKKDRLDSVRVYPNPCSNKPGESGVWFDSLPENSSVKIFDIAGRLVRKLARPENQMIYWDLKNSDALQVASGIYIYVIDAAGIGKEIGKLAVFTFE
jgi:hypothetical protein